MGATLPTRKLEDVYEVIGIPESEFIDGKSGMHGYTKQKICGNIRLLYDGAADMGIHLQMSGQGCREYETYYADQDGHCWDRLFVWLIEFGATFSRFDIAIDEIRYNGERPYWTVAQVIEKAASKELRTRFKRGKRMEDIWFYKEKEGGKTFYFGSDQSLIQFVVYEKDREREANDMELEADLTSWNRFEMRLADDRAQTAAEWIVKGMSAGELAFGIIQNYLVFCDPTSDSNRSRWPVCDWWTAYLNEANRLKLAKRAPDKTIESKQLWINRQVEPTIAQLWYADGSPDPGRWVAKMLENGLERLTEKQVEMAEEYRERMLRAEDEDRQRKQDRHERRKAERDAEIQVRRAQRLLDSERRARDEAAAAFMEDWEAWEQIKKEPLHRPPVKRPMK